MYLTANHTKFSLFLRSKHLHVKRRTVRIFRQAAKSDIVVNAHKINKGESITLDNKSRDFFCMEREDEHGVLQMMLWLVRDKMPKYTDCTEKVTAFIVQCN